MTANRVLLINVSVGFLAALLVPRLTPQAVRPVARFTVSNCAPSQIVPGSHTCTFNGTSSSGRPLSYTWSWSTQPGTPSDSIRKHTFAPGTYCVKLTVRDAAGQSSYATKLLTLPRTTTVQPGACPSAPKPPPVVNPPTKPDTVYLPGRTDTLRLPGRVDTVRVPARVDTVTVGFKTDTLFRPQPPGSIYSTVPANLPAGVTIRSPQSEYAVLRYGVMMGRLSPDYPGNWWAYRATPGRTEMPMLGHYTSALAAIVALTGP